MIHVGVPRPRGCEPPALVHAHDPAESRVVLEKIPRPGPEPSIERIDILVALTAQSIKQSSRMAAKLGDIMHWVKESFPAQEPMVTSVNNLPVDILRVISLGVFHFAECRTQNPPGVHDPQSLRVAESHRDPVD
jgi:hypothetical protein